MYLTELCMQLSSLLDLTMNELKTRTICPDRKLLVPKQLQLLPLPADLQTEARGLLLISGYHRLYRGQDLPGHRGEPLGDKPPQKVRFVRLNWTLHRVLLHL